MISAAYGLPPDQRSANDAAGNRGDANASGIALGTHTYDANNRLTGSPFADVSCYDDDGNLTGTRSAPDTCASGTDTQTFTWDAQNRLRRYENPGTAKDVTYLYDPFGRRIRKTDGSSTTHYLWDGDRLLAEYDGSGVRQVRYAYAGGFAPAQVAYRDGASEDVYDVHTDHLDTPKLLTDDAGAVAWRAAHEAFGKAALDAGNTVTFNVRFPGQYFDAESGLHYNRFRTYDPGVGRYISADPIGQAGGINVFAYATSNPLSLFDPFGLDQYVILVGQQGRGAHNVGNNFQRAADAQAADLTAAGHDVTVSTVSSVDDINNAITSGDKIDGGIIYYGHGWTGAIYPGQDPGPGTNVTGANASSLDGSNLAPGAMVNLNSCNAGTGGPNSIAQAMADALQSSTSGYASPTGFSASPTGNAPSSPGSVPPTTGPIYVRPARGGGAVSYSPR